MRDITIIEQCIERDGVVCGICKQNIEKEIEDYRRYREFALDIKKKKRELQRIQNEYRRQNITLNIDHIKPHSVGGESKIDNYQLTHMSCNNKKGNRFIG